MNLGQTFTKGERIFHQKEIDSLFKEGSSFRSYPLQAVYMAKKPLSGFPVSILLSVSKKRFKRAVKRNRIKRLMREAYRRNKQTLWQSDFIQDKGMLIAFLYISRETCKYETMEAAMKKALDKIAANYVS
ncbi:MAG: ribonuclease P protein component [Candidatus Azobacteroides sp.]|nr:ribonuclease P protein component [Candidatus Azobacteroides sp.]